MYSYSDFDEAFVRSRVAQFTQQVERRLDGSLTEDEFRPLRLMNGLYLQLHAYMLRIAIPYGTLSPHQMRQLAYIADTWDKGYGHFTTRQNIQFNWPKLPDVPAIGESIQGYAVPFWFGLFAAKQTAPEAIRRMNAELGPLAAPDSELSRRMAERGSLLVLSGPDPLAARLRSEVAQWRQVVQAAGITPE